MSWMRISPIVDTYIAALWTPKSSSWTERTGPIDDHRLDRIEANQPILGTKVPPESIQASSMCIHLLKNGARMKQTTAEKRAATAICPKTSP